MLRTADKDIIWPHVKTNYGCKMWRAVITQSLVSFDSLPYDATTNDTLLPIVSLPGNVCTIVGVIGERGIGTDFGKQFESGSCLLTK